MTEKNVEEKVLSHPYWVNRKLTNDEWADLNIWRKNNRHLNFKRKDEMPNGKVFWGYHPNCTNGILYRDHNYVKLERFTLLEKCPDVISWLINIKDGDISFGSRQKITIQCPKCLSKIYRPANDYSSGYRCPFCHGTQVNETNWAFNNELMRKASKEKDILKTVTEKSRQSNIWLCDKCGSEYSNLFYHFAIGVRCGYCAGIKVNETNWAYSNEDMRKASKDIERLKHFSLGSNKQNTWVCEKCGHDYTTPFVTFRDGHRCQKCKSSNGEKQIVKILDRLKLEHLRQYKNENCRNINKLPFDHAIFKDRVLVGLVEFNGKQHYKIIPSWGGETHLQRVQNTDKIKFDYCQNNNIPFLVIPYTDKNLEQTLKDWLKTIVPDYIID